MRLIDADNLKSAIDEALKTALKESSVSKQLTMNLLVGFVHTVLDESPTVKAVSIEWIEDWLNKTTGTRDGEDISQLPEQLKFTIEMINLMEMEWEKEHEDSRFR